MIGMSKNSSCLTKSCNFASGHPLDVVLVSNLRFLSMGIHLEPFLEASDQPEGQELAGGAVGSQEGLQQVKFVLGSNSASEHARDMADMLLVAKLMFLGVGNHLGP